MILFENEHFVVIEKRAGWLSIPGRLGKEDPAPCEIDYWQKERNQKLWIVHRLDREVSGVMCFALSEGAHRAANGWFEKRQIQKSYQALVETNRQVGPPPLGQVKWESRLLRGKKRAYEKPFGKRSVTLAEFVRPYDFHGVSLELWALSPLTGRSHQLRYEMMKHQRPVWGDVLYGSTQKFPLENGIGLRAVKLSFEKVPEREKWQLPLSIEAPELTRWLFSRC